MDVAVYERDRDPASRWEGYRIHVDAAGARSLHACLPAPLWEAFLATSAPGGPIGFVTERLDELVEVEESIAYPHASDPSEGHYAVDRRALRRLLLAGLDEPYLLTAFVTAPDHVPPDLDTDDPDALAGLVDGLTAGWHPTLRRVLAACDPATRGASAFVVAPGVPAWEPSRVTLLGDAVHAVPATGGLGGNTALRDARRLTQALTGGPADVVAAVGAYETDLREHGAAAVAGALAVRDQMLAGGVWRTRAARAWFRLCARSATLRRVTFADGDRALSRPRPWELAGS